MDVQGEDSERVRQRVLAVRAGLWVGAWGIELFCRAGNVARMCRIFRPGRALDVIVPLSFLFRPLRSSLLNSAKMVAQYDEQMGQRGIP